MGKASNVALSSAKRKRFSMGDEMDKYEKPSKRRNHPMVLRSQQCACKEEIPMSRTNIMDSPSRILPDFPEEARRLLPPEIPSFRVSAKQSTRRNHSSYPEGLKRTEPFINTPLEPAMRSTSTMVVPSRREMISQTRRTERDSAISSHTHFPCVRNEAKTFEVYSYVKRRINDAIVLCKGHTRSPTICSPIIYIIFSDDRLGTSTNYCEAFSDIQHKSIETILDEDSSVIVSVGATEEHFATLRKQAEGKPMPPVICKVTCEDPANTYTAGKQIARKPWGFECFAKDLSKENVVACIDDVLEYYAFEMLDRATKHLPESGENAEEIIAEAKELFRDTKVPMPDWLERWEPNSKSQEVKKNLEKLSLEILDLPAVFACEISQESLKIMIRKENESKLKDVIKYLGSLKLSNKEFEISVVEIKPLAADKFRSGDPIRVLGSKANGTLGGFAKLQKNGAEHPKIVAISAEHVLYARDTYKKEIKVKKQETIGERMECGLDIAVGEVTAPRSKCDTCFRTEDGKEGFAEIYQSNVSDLAKKRVHKWGAITSLGTAKISNIKIKPTEAGKCMIIETPNEKKKFARKGDSGSMVLMEQYPRDSPNMYAIGTLVGQLKHKKKKKKNTKRSVTTRSQLKQNKQQFVVVPLKEGFDYLSSKHDGRLSLYGHLDDE